MKHNLHGKSMEMCLKKKTHTMSIRSQATFLFVSLLLYSSNVGYKWPYLNDAWRPPACLWMSKNNSIQSILEGSGNWKSALTKKPSSDIMIHLHNFIIRNESTNYLSNPNHPNSDTWNAFFLSLPWKHLHPLLAYIFNPVCYWRCLRI